MQFAGFLVTQSSLFGLSARHLPGDSNYAGTAGTYMVLQQTDDFRHIKGKRQRIIR